MSKTVPRQGLALLLCPRAQSFCTRKTPLDLNERGTTDVAPLSSCGRLGDSSLPLSSSKTQFRASGGTNRNHRHIRVGKDLSCLGGEEHAVMLPFAR